MMDVASAVTFHFPTTVRFGRGVIKELGSHLKDRGFQRPLLVTDPALSRLPLVGDVMENLGNAGLAPRLFTGVSKNPVKSDVDRGARLYLATGADALVGFGGGASLDVARAMAVKIGHPGDLFDYDDANGGSARITGDIPYFVTIPTTSGTGSEVGRSAVISDDATHRKKIIFSPRLLASIVFADPALTDSLPPALTAATGMDALTHNVEAYLAKGFHPMCDGIALEGIRIIVRHLPRAVNDPDQESRTMMMVGAMMGAVAFQKGLGVVHSTAHALSTRFDLHHGLANAIMIPHGMAFNAEACPDRMGMIALAMGLEQQSGLAVAGALAELNRRIGLPARLDSQGVDASHLDELADIALADFCHLLNPRAVKREDFLELYRRAL